MNILIILKAIYNTFLDQSKLRYLKPADIYNLLREWAEVVHESKSVSKMEVSNACRKEEAKQGVNMW